MKLHSCLAESGSLNNGEESWQMEEAASQAGKFAYELCTPLDELIRWFKNCLLCVPIQSQMVANAKPISFQQFSLEKKKRNNHADRGCSLQRNLDTLQSYDKDYWSPRGLANWWRHSSAVTFSSCRQRLSKMTLGVCFIYRHIHQCPFLKILSVAGRANSSQTFTSLL